MKFHAVLFDAAETLFTTRGPVGELYGSIARQYGSQVSTDKIQEEFQRQFRGAGPLSVQDQKRWWRDLVCRLLLEKKKDENFDQFCEEVYDKLSGPQGWILFPET